MRTPDASKHCLAHGALLISVQEFRDAASTKKVTQQMKLAQFAQAAKLMQGMRSRHRAVKKREAAAGAGEKQSASYLSQKPVIDEHPSSLAKVMRTILLSHRSHS